MNSKRTVANDLVPGTAVHPGGLLRDELTARGMTQRQLAETMGIATNVLSELITGKRNITPEVAVKLEDALDIPAELWMKHQMAYEIDKVRIRNRQAVKKAKLSTDQKKRLAAI